MLDLFRFYFRLPDLPLILTLTGYAEDFHLLLALYTPKLKNERYQSRCYAPCLAHCHMINQTFLDQFDVRTGQIKTVNYELRNIMLFFLTDILIFFAVLLFSESIKYLARTGRTVLLSTASISLAPNLSH